LGYYHIVIITFAKLIKSRLDFCEVSFLFFALSVFLPLFAHKLKMEGGDIGGEIDTQEVDELNTTTNTIPSSPSHVHGYLVPLQGTVAGPAGQVELTGIRRSWKLGRGNSCDIVWSYDGRISREHCIVALNDDGDLEVVSLRFAKTNFQSHFFLFFIFLGFSPPSPIWTRICVLYPTCIVVFCVCVQCGKPNICRRCAAQQG
jgi:hypothetical protein